MMGSNLFSENSRERRVLARLKTSSRLPKGTKKSQAREGLGLIENSAGWLV